MKKRVLTRAVCLLAALALLTSSALAASSIQPRYSKIDSLSADLAGISPIGRATCLGMVTIWDSTCTAILTVSLQQSSDGGETWTTIKSWSKGGPYGAAIEEYWYVNPGYDYRVLSTASSFMPDGALVETVTAKSAVIHY